MTGLRLAYHGLGHAYHDVVPARREHPVVDAQSQFAFHTEYHEDAVEPHILGALHISELVEDVYPPVVKERTGHVQIACFYPFYIHIDCFSVSYWHTGNISQFARLPLFACKETIFPRNRGYLKLIMCYPNFRTIVKDAYQCDGHSTVRGKRIVCRLTACRITA